MLRTLSLFVIFSFICTTGKSQKDIYFGLAFGPKGDLYNYYDPANQLSNKPVFNGPNFHFKLEYFFSHRVSMSSGLIFNNYGERYKLNYTEPYEVGTFDAFFGLEVPIRGHLKLVPWKEENNSFSFGITMGYHLLFNSDYQSLRTIEKRPGENDPGIIISSITRNENARFFNLIESGLFLNYRLHPRWLLGFSGGKVQGFKTIVDSQIFYSTNRGNSIESAFARSKGNYIFLHIEFKYRLTKD